MTVEFKVVTSGSLLLLFMQDFVFHHFYRVYGALPTWLSMSGKTFFSDAMNKGHTNFNLPSGLTTYSSQFHRPSWHNAASYGRVHSRGLMRVTGVTSHLNAASNMPSHTRRDIFVCLSNRGPARCDVVSNRLQLYNPRGSAWGLVSWYSVDGVVSFRSMAGFASLALTSGKTHYGGSYANASYRRISGQVYLRGLVRLSQAITSSNNLVATLPSGYRPRRREVFLTNCGSRFCRVDVLPDGRIVLVHRNDLRWVSLAGISFVSA